LLRGAWDVNLLGCALILEKLLGTGTSTFFLFSVIDCVSFACNTTWVEFGIQCYYTLDTLVARSFNLNIRIFLLY
jgi:hypothetical protein